jgi:hypothetical protein
MNFKSGFVDLIVGYEDRMNALQKRLSATYGEIYLGSQMDGDQRYNGMYCMYSLVM